MLRDINESAGAVMPAGAWDVLQLVAGLWIFIGVLLQRRASPRFQRSSIICVGDAFTVLAGQIGLAMIGVIGALLVIDALLPPPSPPRTLIVLLASGFGLIQARVMYEIIAEWFDPLKRSKSNQPRR